MADNVLANLAQGFLAIPEDLLPLGTANDATVNGCAFPAMLAIRHSDYDTLSLKKLETPSHRRLVSGWLEPPLTSALPSAR
jgi:hypothetical protein